MQRLCRFALIVFEVALLTPLIVVTRCANYQDVFVAGNVYFVDADCYARMTRAEMIRAKPGLIIRHHAFENFPQGTTPHTTAPLDYLIVALSLFLNPFTAHTLDLAGAFVSPVLALLGGWFLWWWSRRMKFRYRWVLLILYAISPILVHGTELGRPDHQSLLILLVAIAISAGWSSQIPQPRNLATGWWLTSAASWALAIWVSAYEPVVLFVIITATALLMNHRAVVGRESRSARWSRSRSCSTRSTRACSRCRRRRRTTGSGRGTSTSPTTTTRRWWTSRISPAGRCNPSKCADRWQRFTC